MLDTLQNEAADVKHDKKNHYQLVYQTARSYIFWDAVWWLVFYLQYAPVWIENLSIRVPYNWAAI